MEKLNDKKFKKFDRSNLKNLHLVWGGVADGATKSTTANWHYTMLLWVDRETPASSTDWAEDGKGNGCDC